MLLIATKATFCLGCIFAVFATDGPHFFACMLNSKNFLPTASRLATLPCYLSVCLSCYLHCPVICHPALLSATLPCYLSVCPVICTALLSAL